MTGLVLSASAPDGSSVVDSDLCFLDMSLGDACAALEPAAVWNIEGAGVAAAPVNCRNFSLVVLNPGSLWVVSSLDVSAVGVCCDVLLLMLLATFVFRKFCLPDCNADLSTINCWAEADAGKRLPGVPAIDQCTTNEYIHLVSTVMRQSARFN